MSRGLGAVERFVLDVTTRPYWVTAAGVIQALAEQRKITLSPSTEATVRRALAALLRKGLVQQNPNHKTWRSLEGARQAEALTKDEEENWRQSRRREPRPRPAKMEIERLKGETERLGTLIELSREENERLARPMTPAAPSGLTEKERGLAEDAEAAKRARSEAAIQRRKNRLGR